MRTGKSTKEVERTHVFTFVQREHISVYHHSFGCSTQHAKANKTPSWCAQDIVQEINFENLLSTIFISIIIVSSSVIIYSRNFRHLLTNCVDLDGESTFRKLSATNGFHKNIPKIIMNFQAWCVSYLSILNNFMSSQTVIFFIVPLLIYNYRSIRFGGPGPSVY